MRVVFMGSPSYAIPVLEAVMSLDHQVAGVYTQPDKPAGRGRAPEATPLKAYALERGLAVLQPPSLRRPEAQEALAALEPQVVVVAAYGKFLPPAVLEMPAHGCLNVHPSLLPRHRGPSPVATAILDGDAVTGTTIILLDPGMDSGPILTSREVPVDARATTESLTPVLFQAGAQLLTEVLPLWLEGRLSPVEQAHSQATVTRLLERSDGEADWQLPAVDLERRLRAFTPWPGLFTRWRGKVLKVLGASLLQGPGEGYPPGPVPGPLHRPVAGKVVALGEPKASLGVATGEGVLGLKTLQLEGRRAVSALEFLRGYPDFPGSRLPS